MDLGNVLGPTTGVGALLLSAYGVIKNRPKDKAEVELTETTAAKLSVDSMKISMEAQKNRIDDQQKTIDNQKVTMDLQQAQINSMQRELGSTFHKMNEMETKLNRTLAHVERCESELAALRGGK